MLRSRAGRPVLAQSQDLFVGLRKGFGCWNNLICNIASMAFVQSKLVVNRLQTGWTFKLEAPWSPFSFCRDSFIFLPPIFSAFLTHQVPTDPSSFPWLLTYKSPREATSQRSMAPVSAWLYFCETIVGYLWGCGVQFLPLVGLGEERVATVKDMVKDMENNGKWLKWHLADLSTQSENDAKSPRRCDQMSSKSMSAGLMGTLVSKIFDTDHGIVPTP